MSSDDQQADGIFGSIIRSIRSACSKISGTMPLTAGNSPCSKKENIDGNSNVDDPKYPYIWEAERGDGYYMRIFYCGWVLERKSGWISSSYRLRNPISRRVLDLPDPKEKYSYHMAPKYLPSRKTLKMVFPFPNRKTGNLSFKLLTIGIDDSWRTLDFPSTTCKLTKAKWLTDVSFHDDYVIAVLPETGNNNDAATIACLEVESEKLWSINVSKDFIYDGTENVVLVNWAGKPALARKLENDLLFVWVVEDYRNQKWAEEKIMIDLTDMKAARRNCTPFYFDGDKLWMHRDDGESYLTFDIVSKVVVHIDAPKKTGKKCFNEKYCILKDLEGSKPLKE